MKGPRDERVEATARERHTLVAGRDEVLEELGDGAAGTAHQGPPGLLGHAPGQGVVHGALTPGSVRMPREAPPRALLSGFATAAAAARVPYSAPEQIAGTRVDPRSDVFALGLLLFEMLEGKRFFRGRDE